MDKNKMDLGNYIKSAKQVMQGVTGGVSDSVKSLADLSSTLEADTKINVESLVDRIMAASSTEVADYTKDVKVKSGSYIHKGGDLFMALADTTSAPETSSDYIRLYHSPVHHGEYDYAGQYTKGDTVIDADGNRYTATKDFARGEPGVSSDWQLFVPAVKGAKGDQGDQGLPGKDGKDGASIKTVTYEEGALLIEDTHGNYKAVQLDLVKVVATAVNAYTDTYKQPIREFRGIWQSDQAYPRGSLIVFKDALIVVVKDLAIGEVPVDFTNPDSWGPDAKSVMVMNVPHMIRDLVVDAIYDAIAVVEKKIKDFATGFIGAQVEAYLNTPPSTTGLATGSLYLIGTAPTGAWATKTNQRAEWKGTTWEYTEFDVNRVGYSHYSKADDTLFTWTGSIWRASITSDTFTMVVQNTEPVVSAKTKVGDLWLDTTLPNSPIFKFYYNNTWVPLDNRLYLEPNAPVVATANVEGDLHYDTNTGIRYVFTTSNNIRQWVRLSQSYIFSATSPVTTTAVHGDHWIDTDEGNRLKVFNTATDTFISVNKTTFVKTTKPAVTETVAGDFWLDTTIAGSPQLNVNDGTTWHEIGASSIRVQPTEPTTNLQAGKAWLDNSRPGNPKFHVHNGIGWEYSNKPCAYGTTLPAVVDSVNGDLWLDTDTNRLYFFNVKWTPVNRLNTYGGDRPDIRPNAKPSIPGDTWYDLVTKAYYLYTENDGWVAINKVHSVRSTQPASASLGDVWIDTDETNRIKYFDGTNWINASNILSYSPTAPATTLTGDTWVDSDENNRVKYYNGATWVAATNVVYADNNEPTTKVQGDLWIDTDNANKVSFYDGTNWLAITNVTTVGNVTPTTPSKGDLWADTFSTTNVRYKYYDGAAWKSLNTVTIVGTTATGTREFFIGDKWLDSADGNRAYIYDGTNWVVEGSPHAYISTTAPTKQRINDLWIDSSTSRYRVKVYDGAAWVTFSQRTFIQNTVPTNDGELLGDIWVDTLALANIRYNHYDGIQWVPMSTVAFERNVDPAVNAPMRSYVAGDLWMHGITRRQYKYTGAQWAPDNNVLFRGTTAPVNPINGDLWIDSSDGDRLRYYDGINWLVATNRYTTSVNAPTNPQNNDIWYSTGDKLMRVYEFATSTWITINTTVYNQVAADITYTATDISDAVVTTFNNTGTLNVPANAINIRYTIVGGGGGANGGVSGVTNPISGGGGAVVQGQLSTADVTAWRGKSLTVTIGGGGAFGNAASTAGGTGQTSSISGTGITTVSAAGGNGAGATSTIGGASGNGNAGANGGGGGAGAAAQTATRTVGGVGVASIITGTVYGAGGSFLSAPAHAGANTGGGGHGGNLGTRSGNGGSGVVIVSYQTESQRTATVSAVGPYKVTDQEGIDAVPVGLIFIAVNQIGTTAVGIYYKQAANTYIKL